MVKPETIRSILVQGKGRISAGRAEEVAALVLAQPRLAPRMMECLWDDDPAVANRAAHALERITRYGGPVAASILGDWKAALLGLLPEATENKLRWHLALVVPRMQLTPVECRRAAQALHAWLEDGSSIVKTMALQGLYDLIRQDASLLPPVVDLLRIHGRSGTPAMRARSRQLLIQLEKPQKTAPK